MDIKLSQDEALILYDWINKIAKNENISTDIAERQVLWKVEAQLDKELDESFMSNYIELVKDAKGRIREHNGIDLK